MFVIICRASSDDMIISKMLGSHLSFAKTSPFKVIHGLAAKDYGFFSRCVTGKKAIVNGCFCDFHDFETLFLLHF